MQKKVRERKVKDIDCTNSECVNGVVKVYNGDNDYTHQDQCEVCGGVGYLNDAAGRIRPVSPVKAPVSIEDSRARFRKEMGAAKDDKAKATAFLGHAERSAEYDGGAARFLKAARGASAKEVLAAANEKRLPVACGCNDGKVNHYDNDNNVVDTIECLMCSGSGKVA